MVFYYHQQFTPYLIREELPLMVQAVSADHNSADTVAEFKMVLSVKRKKEN